MSDSSDGNKTKATQKKVFIPKKTIKTRSNSLEINLNKSEINSTIGVNKQHSDATSASNASTGLSDVNTFTNLSVEFLQGDAEKLKSICNEEIIFKPRKSIARSPAKTDKTTEEIDKDPEMLKQDEENHSVLEKTLKDQIPAQK